MDEKTLKKTIQAELRGNLQVLIDPKRKDSFSNNRINTWVDLVTDRIIYHLK